jgi:hypothetical protein
LKSKSIEQTWCNIAPLREPVRKDREKHSKLQALREAIDDRLKSGVSSALRRIIFGNDLAQRKVAPLQDNFKVV